MEPTFKRKHAKEILSPCGIDRYITIDKRGIWPKVQRDMTMQAETELLRWRPARVFQGEPDAPEVADTPMLPFPFTARHLAAFMLEGVGALVAGFYGDWDDAPDPKSLKQIDPDSNARTAIAQAYAAHREAQRTIGEPPLALIAEADRARKAWNVANQAANEREGVSAAKPDTDDLKTRRARAKALTVELDSEMEATAAEARAAQEAWLNAMVRELLLPAPAQNIATPAPVEIEEIDFTMVATRKELIDAFGKFTGMDVTWFDNLNTSPKLKAARKFTGQGGRGRIAEPLFCPYEVMQWLADPKRRKGKPLSVTTAWRLLKNHFSKVHNQYSIGDPNAV